MSRDAVEIGSLSELTSAVDDLCTKSKLRWWYRGHSRADWPLRPSIWRNHSREQEHLFAHEFRARAGTRHSVRPDFNDYADWLALMQHYGVPTRLLDWSRAPLVAAFFAVQPAMPHAEGMDRGDACIWALAPTALNEAQGYEPVLYALNAQKVQPLVEPAFTNAKSPDLILAAVPIESDIRMQVQQGVVTIHATGKPIDELRGASDWLRKIVIPRKRVAAVAREIEILGLGLAELFPDLGNLAKDLRARYRPLKDDENR